MAQIILPTGAVPANPTAGNVTVYAKTDGFIYGKDSAGVETPLSAIADASAITNTPAGNIAATTVQAAINELDSEKSPLAGSASLVTTGAVTGTSFNSMTGLASVAPVAPEVTAVVGVSTLTARQDHVHPTNFTATATDIKMDGVQAVGVLTTFPRADHVHPSDTTKTTSATLAAAGGAALVGNTPAGNISGATVQAALNELDAEKAKLAGDAAQVFSVAPATAATHAVNKLQMDTADALRALLAGSSGQNFAANVLTLATVLATASGGNGHALGSMNQLLRSTTDWNTATTAGRYVAQGASNAPSGITDWLNVTVERVFDGSDQYISQVGVTVTAGAYMFHRVSIAGTWSAWKAITAV